MKSVTMHAESIPAVDSTRSLPEISPVSQSGVVLRLKYEENGVQIWLP
jgi:hypothetical protein